MYYLLGSMAYNHSLYYQLLSVKIIQVFDNTWLLELELLNFFLESI